MTVTRDKDFYTVAEAAELLSLSPSVIRSWIKSGKLRAVRVGPRNLRIRRADLEAMVTPVLPAEHAAQRKGPRIADPNDIWKDYDPERTRVALRKSAGALSGVDRDQLVADIYAQRGQDSKGRPGD